MAMWPWEKNKYISAMANGVEMEIQRGGERYKTLNDNAGAAALPP